MVTRKNDSAMEITNHEFKDIINNSHKLVVVDFFADWCMPCLMLTPVLEELADNMKEVKFVKINVDDNQELSRKYEVRSIPCLIIFKDGKEVDRIIGNRTREEIERRINNFATKKYES